MHTHSRQVDHIFPEGSHRLCWSTQYLARVRFLRVVEEKRTLCYHYPLCVRCRKRTATFHTLLLRYLCTGCTNRYTLTYELISQKHACKLYGVERGSLRFVAAAQFCSRANVTSKFFLCSQVKQLEYKLFKNKATARTHAARAARPCGDKVEKASSLAKSYRREAEKKAASWTPAPQNSAVCMDLTKEPPSDRIIHRSRSQLLKSNLGVKRAGAKINVEVRRYRMRTVGLSGCVVQDPVLKPSEDTKENRRKAKRRIQQRLRRERIKKEKMCAKRSVQL